MKVKEEELKKLAEMTAKREADVTELERRQQQLISVSINDSGNIYVLTEQPHLHPDQSYLLYWLIVNLELSHVIVAI